MSDPVQDEEQIRRKHTQKKSRHPDDYIIHHSYDWGTRTAAVGCQMLRRESLPHPDQTSLLRLQISAPEVKQTVGFIREDADWVFYWGEELLDALSSEKPAEEDVYIFDSLKMCLYPSKHQVQARCDTQAKLDRLCRMAKWHEVLTLEWLIAYHLRELEKAAMADTKKLFPQFDIDQMDVHSFFTVPEISTDATRKAFTDSIRKAGLLGGVTLVTETVSAAAWRIHELKKDIHGHLPHPEVNVHP